MEKQLNEKKAAILATDGFEQSEFEKPIEALKKAGIIVDVISIKEGKIKGWKEKNWGDEFKVDKSIDTALSTDYDILVLPGGVINSDSVRVNESAVKFVNNIFDQGKPIAAICHASWILIETGKLKGKRLTSYKTIKTDLINAGADWEDAEVVIDNGLISSRSPKDLPAFCKAILEEIKKEIDPDAKNKFGYNLKSIVAAIFGFAFLLLVACNNQHNQKAEIQIPSTLQSDKDLLQQAQVFFQPLPNRAESTDNPITPEKIKLGKLLYFDTRLSKTGNNSCNSCHNLATYGVDNLPFSKGDAGKLDDRNSPTCLNAAFHVAQFWDGSAKDVEEQAGVPILNPVEMAIPSKAFLEKKLKGTKEYVGLFKAAYPTDKEPLTFINIQKSIGAFERTLVTPSPFDNYLKNNYTALNTDQKAGLKTFIDIGCIQCHNGIAIGGSSFQKFGVYGDYRTFTHSTSNDEGRKKITKQESDKDFFKVPSLRNVAKTFPYFHDGSVSDLKEAVLIMGKAQLNKDLTEAQVKEIVAFLNSLTGNLPDEAKNSSEILSQK